MRPVSVLSLSTALAMQAIAAPELIVDIDFNDEVYVRSEPITEAQVEKLVRDLHQQGVQTLLVRMGYLGYLPYRTDLSYPIGFDAEAARKRPLDRKPKAPDEVEKYIKSHEAWNARYRKVIDAFNPPEVFIRVGHQLGMKVIMWLDIFDDGYPGYRSKFIDQNPQCQWTARDGKTRFEGLVSYAWPESRAFRVAQAKELLDLGADGIHCSTSAHCRHLPNLQEDDAYGFEQPVVDEYLKRHGIDIRSAATFDRESWHTVKGEFMNQLYRELATLCHQRRKELWVGLQLGEYTHLAADPYFGKNVVARYRNLWKTLVDENIADAFIVGDYEICTQPAHAYWQVKGLQTEPGQDLFAWAANCYQGYCRGKTRLHLFSEWLPGSPEALDSRMTAWAERVVKHGFDGIDVHEAVNFEGAGGMAILGRMRSRLDGKNVPPFEPARPEPAAPNAQPAGVAAVSGVSRGGPALIQPTDDTGGQVTRYGLGFVFQVGPQTAAVSCNIRTVGRGHWDFEDGSDVVVFEDLATIGRQKAVVCARNVADTNPATGRRRAVVTYPIAVGFVPLGARRSDGTGHPYAGTGFGFSQGLCFDLNEEGFFTWEQPSTKRWFVHQFAYDGTSFRVVKMETKDPDAPLKTTDGAWTLTAPGLSCAIPDGDDLLFAVAASDGARSLAGVSRWRPQGGDWRPVTFHGVSGGSEPSLVRDVDGALLYSVRGDGKEGQAVRVWRSRDGAQNWEPVLHAPGLRANAPVALSQAADGTPYIAANEPTSSRAKLCLWPLRSDRAGVGLPVLARDCVAEFGPPPQGTTRFADHATATTVRLADGQWHNLLAYRVMAFSTAGVGGETLTPRTGCYVEEVFSTGPKRSPWRF